MVNLQMWSAMGVAIVGAPLVASRLTAKQSYVGSVAAALLQLGAESKFLEETLPKEQMKPFTGS